MDTSIARLKQRSLSLFPVERKALAGNEIKMLRGHRASL